MTTPLIEQRADPYIYRHTDGTYYFTASVPEFDLIELRRAKSISGLRDAKPVTVWRKRPSGDMSCNIWAPELHYIGGKWMIYFAAARQGADASGCYDHRTYALENDADDPFTGEFREMGQINTGRESFTLDSTSFTAKGRRYFVWAQRDPAITGNSNLYIAEMLDPTTLRLPATLLSVPEYPWECQGFLVNEGPAVLKHGGRLYMTYSGSATDERYCVGMLTADESADPLDKASWQKSKEPVMVTEPRNGLYGPGHNSFTVDERGRDIIVFHARPYPGFHGSALGDPNRHAYTRLVRYDEDEAPVFRDGGE